MVREIHKKTLIRFVNPRIHIISWSWILTPKRFYPCLTKWILDSYPIVDHESWLKKICFEWLITNQVNFQRFTNSYTSRFVVSRIRIRKSEPWRFVSQIRCIDLFCIVDSICVAKNFKLLDSFRFRRIRVWIHQP